MHDGIQWQQNIVIFPEKYCKNIEYYPFIFISRRGRELPNKGY